MDAHVQRNTASFAEVVGAEFAAEVVDLCVLFADDGHLGDGGVGTDVAVLGYGFMSYEQ